MRKGLLSAAVLTDKTVILTAVSVLAVSAAVLMGNGSLAGMATAQDSNDTSNVSVTVDGVTTVTLSPDSYNFSALKPTEANFSERSDLQLVISNEGSTNITDVYAHANTLESEDDNPLGTGQANEYGAGRFFWIKNESSGFYHAGSISWNQTEEAGGKPSGITNEPSNSKAWGYYRNATGNYLWALSNDGSQYCNSSASGVTVTMKNESDTGDNRDLGQDSVGYTLDLDQDGNWSVGQASEGPLEGHYLAAWKNCNKYYIYRFDHSSMFPGSGTDQHLISDQLTPGSTHTGRVGAAIPQGIPQGETNQTQLTVFATGQTN